MAIIPPQQVNSEATGGILRRMADLYDMYLLVRITDRIASKEEKVSSETYRITNHYTRYTPPLKDVKAKFIKPHRWSRKRSEEKWNCTLGLAIKKKYIKRAVRFQDGVRLTSLQIYADDLNGTDLIQRSFFRLLPKGLLLAWAEKNSKLVDVTWLFIGVIIANLGNIVKFAHHHL